MLQLLYIHHSVCGRRLALCHPGINASFEVGIRNELFVLETFCQSSHVRITYGTLLNGSSSLESNTVRIVALSMTTRETGRMTGSFITGP
jgi:hypothetical protein